MTEVTINQSLQIIDYGIADYREILQTQHELRDKRREGKIPNTVLIVEHPPVITLGARQSANKLLASKDDLEKQHIDVVDIRRGGGATAHNPGQLVFYPILHLQELGLEITEYIRTLEAIGIELLQQLGVRADRRQGFPGLWVLHEKSKIENLHRTPYGGKSKIYKIASIGVRVSKSVTYHGMAINIQNDLSIFDLLVPCGLDGVEITSVLKETGMRHPMDKIKNSLAQLIKKYLGMKLEKN